MATRSPSFYDVLTAAMRDVADNGYDSAERLAHWQRRLRAAAETSLLPRSKMMKRLSEAYRSLYRKLVDKEEILRMHPGVERFTLAKVRPQLHSELERRIMASAELISMNREQAIQKTLQRFSGWATSIPKGGSKAVDKVKERDDIRKSLSSLPFEERRVLVDQGHKFTAALSETLATDGGALAGVWRSNWRQANYDYRSEHKERDGRVFAVRGNWALAKGLMKKGDAGFTDDITKPGEEVFCRCRYQWIYSLRSLPDDMLTKKGKDALAAVRVRA